MSLALYMVMSDFGAAGMMMMGVLDTRFPDPLPLPAAGAPPTGRGTLPVGLLGPPPLAAAAAAAAALRAWLAAAWLPSVTDFKVMPEKVPVVSMLKPCVSSLLRKRS